MQIRAMRKNRGDPLHAVKYQPSEMKVLLTPFSRLTHSSSNASTSMARIAASSPCKAISSICSGHSMKILISVNSRQHTLQLCDLSAPVLLRLWWVELGVEITLLGRMRIECSAQIRNVGSLFKHACVSHGALQGGYKVSGVRCGAFHTRPQRVGVIMTEEASHSTIQTQLLRAAPR